MAYRVKSKITGLPEPSKTIDKVSTIPVYPFFAFKRQISVKSTYEPYENYNSKFFTKENLKIWY